MRMRPSKSDQARRLTATRRSIFARFLKFGALAWGGPAAQIAMIKHECVDEEGWVSEETFKKTLAVYQVLPGPEAHELCVYFGRIRGGRLGGFLAGLGFMLPGFVLMLGLSILYVEAEPRRAPRRALLRAHGGGRRDRRPGARPAQRDLHHRRPAGADRGRGVRADAVRRRELRPRPARRRARLRAVDQRRALDAARATRSRSRRPCSVLARRRGHASR